MGSIRETVTLLTRLILSSHFVMSQQMAIMVKNPTANPEDIREQVRSLG